MKLYRIPRDDPLECTFSIHSLHGTYQLGVHLFASITLQLQLAIYRPDKLYHNFILNSIRE